MRRPRFFSEQIPSAFSEIVWSSFPILGNHANRTDVFLEFGSSWGGFTAQEISKVG